VTLWGHNFGPDPGTLQVCIQAGCSDGQMNVCLSAACGNAYYVWSDQQINALIQPGSAPDGTYQWTLCSYGESGTSPICLYSPFLFPFPESSPTLTLYQNGTNITNVVQTAPYIVGQQLSFTIASTLGTPINPSWSASGGSYVGGYKVPLPSALTNTPYPACLVDANAAIPTACITPGAPLVNMSLQTLTIYFTQPTNGPVTVTFQQGSLLNASSVSTTFNVIGPYLNGTNMGHGLGSNGITIDGNSFTFSGRTAVHYGGSVTGAGMTFYESGVTDLAGVPEGSYQWVQVLSSSNLTINTSGQVDTSTPQSTFACIGLDGTYPYGTLTETDSPATLLLVGDEEVSKSGEYQMFLMYQPNLTAYPNSIWVPVAVIPWSWSALVVSFDGGVDWNFESPAPTASPTGNFYGSTTATPPLWNTVCPPSQTPPLEVQ
jgi:hypothetical protein